jgi:hypothetical protein
MFGVQSDDKITSFILIHYFESKEIWNSKSLYYRVLSAKTETKIHTVTFYNRLDTFQCACTPRREDILSYLLLSSRFIRGG